MYLGYQFLTIPVLNLDSRNYLEIHKPIPYLL